jgi:hypothetical protein
MAHDWELGAPLTYDDKSGPNNIPLSRSTIWPADMDTRSAEFFATKIERDLTAKIGAVPCGMGHESWWLPDGGCSWCGAVV